MYTAIKVPLRTLSPALIRDWQDKYPDAEVSVLVHQYPAQTSMNEQRFWEIIALLDWNKESDDDILAPAVKALSTHSELDIRQFSEILARKLYELDGERFAKELSPENAWNETGEVGHFSVDVFLYARCCVVANGREFFEEVLNDPTKMPKGYDFEALLYMPHAAWKLQTGQEDYFQYTDFWYETFSNPEGWPGIIPLKDRITGTNG